MSTDRVKVWKLTLGDGNPLVVDNPEYVAEQLGFMEPGDEADIECAEMDRAVLDNLPEWDGP